MIASHNPFVRDLQEKAAAAAGPIHSGSFGCIRIDKKNVQDHAIYILKVT
jgi:hypothetical protein